MTKKKTLLTLTGIGGTFGLIIGILEAISIIFNPIIKLCGIFCTIVIIILLVVIIAIYYYYSKKNSEQVIIKYIKDSDEINEVLVKYLKNTTKSLYYFGGAGFINTYDKWETTLGDKLQDPSFEVHRIIDLKKPKDLKPLLIKMYGENVDVQIENYKKWIEMHRKQLEMSAVNNFFYSYEGAPIWKHGMNYIVFDKKILVLITPIIREGSTSNKIERRKVVIIPDHRIAKEFADSIKLVIAQFQLIPHTVKDLDKVYHKDKTE